MENIKDASTFRDYRFANISEDDIKKITDLEQKISSETKEDIVLIAYGRSTESL